MRQKTLASLLLSGLLSCGLGLATAHAQTGDPVTAQANGTLLGMSRLSTNHTTLLRALKAAGLEEAANGSTKYTVFAPTNAAFDKLPAGQLDALLKPTAKNRLASLLAYHVVPGSYLAANLQDGQQLQTVQGETLTVMRQGATITLKDSKGATATVLNDDIVAENGVIHSIDTVLMPTRLPAK